MIKILHSSDWHLDQLSKWSTKKSKTVEWITEFTQYHLDIVQDMVDYTIKNKIQFFVFAWDLFHDSLSNHKEKDIIYKELLKKVNQLKEHWIYTILLSGNHDITRRIKEQSKTNSLELFHNINYDDFLFVNTAESNTLDFKDYEIDWEVIRVILFPYLRGVESKSDVYEILQETISEAPEWAKTIIVWHLDIFGALYNWVEIQSLDLKDTNTWHPEELEESWADLILLWHVHNHQVLWQEKTVIYCGSPFRLSFNEEGIEKGFYVHTLGDTIKSKFHELENKKWKTFEIDVFETKWSFLSLVEDIKNEDLEDAIVRIKINNIEKKDYKYIPTKEILDILNSKDIFLFRWYSYNERRIVSSVQTDLEGNTVENLVWENWLLNSLQSEIEPKHILENILREDKSSDEFISKSLEELNTILSELEE